MKKTQKRIFGAFGLAAVVAMTAFAATLPGPEASAIDTVTDTIQVRVVEASADINIVSPTSGTVFTEPEQELKVSYSGVDEATITITYTGRDGIPHSYVTSEAGLDYDPVDKTYPIDLAEEGRYGFGDYVVSVKGVGMDGEIDEDVIRFSYLPIKADLTEDTETGDYTVHMDYVPDDGTEEGAGKVADITINILDQNGNPVEPSPIKVKAPTDEVTFNLDEYGLPSGTYTVELTAYDRYGNILYKPFVVGVIDYQVIPTPDTGAPFQNLNISRIDYLITGLIVFSLVGISGFVYISRKNKSTSRRRRK